MAREAPSADSSDILRRIHDLEAALEAIRGGGVDALAMGRAGDPRVYSLVTADQSYRTIVEDMGEGAATVSERGTVLYANARFAELFGRSRTSLLGVNLTEAAGRHARDVLLDMLSVAAGGVIERHPEPAHHASCRFDTRASRPFPGGGCGSAVDLLPAATRGTG